MQFLQMFFLKVSGILLATARSAASRASAGTGTSTAATAATTAASGVVLFRGTLIMGIYVPVNVHVVTVSAQKSAPSAIGNVGVNDRNLYDKGYPDHQNKKYA